MEKAQVLIVEDDGIIAMDLESRMKKLGYGVAAIVGYGEQAIGKVKENAPDVVLMDIILKGEIDGIEAAEGIRTQYDIPVIFITGYADKDRLKRAKLTYPFGFIVKPFQDKDLEITIEMTLYVAKVDAERKQAEESLRESEEKYRELVENANSIILRYDLNGKIIFFNEYAQRFFGYRQDEILGKDVMIIVPKVESSGRSLGTLAQDILEIPEEFEENINQNICKNGEIVWISWRNKAIKDSEGKVIGNLAIGQDITARKQAEESLRESEEKFKLLAAATIEGIAFHEKGLILDGNDRFVEMFGYDSVTEMLDMKINVTQLASPKMREIVGKNATEGYSEAYEAEGLRKNGSIFPIILHGRQIPHEGKIVRLTSVRDITEQKKAEEALQKAHDELEQRVEERTRELELQKKSLEELNIAMKVLLKKRAEDKTEVEENVMTNVKKLILPYFDKINQTKLDDYQKAFLNILESNLDEIVSPFTRKLSLKYLSLTPREITIVNMIKIGYQSKKIAKLMKISPRTVDTHRKNIRSKIGLGKKKGNLRSHLLAFEQ